MFGLALTLLVGCDTPASMFERNVGIQIDRVRNLQYGKVSCMHCPMYFRFEVSKSLVDEIVKVHDLKKVVSIPEEMSSVLKVIDVPWWIRGKPLDGAEKYFNAYDLPQGAGGERRIRVAVVHDNVVYFITNGYPAHDITSMDKNR